MVRRGGRKNEGRSGSEFGESVWLKLVLKIEGIVSRFVVFRFCPALGVTCFLRKYESSPFDFSLQTY